MAGTPDDLLPDRGPLAARQALAAAHELRVFDGPATAWLVVQRVLEVWGMAMLLGGIAYGSVLVGQWVWVVAGLAVVAFAWEGPVGRLVGAQPKPWRARWRILLVLAFATAILLMGVGAFGTLSPAATGLASWVLLVAVGYLLTPILRWATTGRRPGGAAWPDGAQGYAVLSVLSRAQWVHPDRLSVLTGLPRDRCDDWVAACAARGLLVPGGRRMGLRRHAEITASGLARLDRWTSELTRRAAGAQPWTDSTAPTSADVIVDSSSSEVT